MIESLQSTFWQLVEFLKNPVDQPASDQRLSNKALQLLLLFIIDVVLIMAIILPLTEIIQRTGLVDMDNHEINKLMDTYPRWQIVLLAGVFAPILEELIFRTFLTYKRNYPLKMIVAIAGFGGIRKKARVNAHLKKGWRKYYHVIFYSIAIAFAYVHITNFENTDVVLLLSPLLVLPQFFAALTLGYIRVKYGLVWSILLHSMRNVVFMGIAFWGMDMEKNKENEEKDTVMEASIWMIKESKEHGYSVWEPCKKFPIRPFDKGY